MENFKPILLNFTEDELRSMAAEKAETIVIRTYENGISQDEERPSTETEKTILINLIYGALLAIRFRDDSAQAAMDTAEFISHGFFDGINCYYSVYLPIQHILRECREKVKEMEKL